MYEGLSNLHLMARARNYNAWMFGAVRPYLGQRVLEVGAGIGTFTELMAGLEEVVATDMDSACLAELASRFAGCPNVSVRHLDLDHIRPDFREALRRKRLDSIVCFNVLEHIEDDVHALRSMRELLTSGRLLLVVPALQALYGVEDRAVGHHRRYGKGEIVEKMRLAGWRVERVRYFNSLGAILWFVNNRLLKKSATTEGNVYVYDKIIVPVMSRLEAALPVPFGQSLVVIGKT